MKQRMLVAALALACPFSSFAQTAGTSPQNDDVPSKELGVVTVTSSRPTSLPTQIPTTTQGVTREDIARTVNATDSEDALKYFPSLLVRKRYIGDYNHAILSSRASGTGNSARSAVYADGILLSNYLGNGVSGLSFPPRWGMVTPEEIDRVDVMYGPFSAIYPGNSVGAVVDYVTHMPKKLEAHAKAGYVSQPFELYGHSANYRAWQTSASLGNRSGEWAWWVNVNHTDSEGQPLTFANRLVSNGTSSNTGTRVTGAVLAPNSANQPWYLIGSGTQYHTVQDHLKVKLAYDVTPTIRASYVLGIWQNKSDGNSVSWLKDANGNAVYRNGPVNINGTDFINTTTPQSTQALSGSDFAVTRESLQHTMHGLSVKSHTRGEWDWEVVAGLYDYANDDKRQNASSNPQPAALTGGAGTLADGSGTGWQNLALKGTWRPAQTQGAHVVDFGYQLDHYELAYRTTNLSGNYLTDTSGALANQVSGQTRQHSIYAQDTWKLAPRWRTVLGLRAENWQAFEGRTDFSASSATNFAERSVTQLSPKAALSWQWLNDTVLKASLGRAVRMPTVGELYGATSTSNSRYINDPNLKPEKSWTSELTAEKDMGAALARLTFFAEQTRDAIYSQTVYDAGANKNISRVQNVGRIATKGIESALSSEDWLVRGLDLQGSITYTESLIKSNDGFVTTPGDTIGKWQPNIPRWRATALASYRLNESWTGALAIRYSGKQYRTLNNADDNGYAYMGVSPYTTADVRVRYRINKQWHASFGIENLNNDKYWNFHPYPQRSYSVELSFDL
jgi:iron complex outermembrane receptor protein